jgi:hypothetical protein
LLTRPRGSRSAIRWAKKRLHGRGASRVARGPGQAHPPTRSRWRRAASFSFSFVAPACSIRALPSRPSPADQGGRVARSAGRDGEPCPQASVVHFGFGGGPQEPSTYPRRDAGAQVAVVPRFAVRIDRARRRSRASRRQDVRHDSAAVAPPRLCGPARGLQRERNHSRGVAAQLPRDYCRR